MHVGFFIRHFTERGTEVSTYDYAKYNEEILNNTSYIICFTSEAQARYGFPLERYSYSKFQQRFHIIEIGDLSDMVTVIEKYNLSYFYTQTHGGWDIYQFENKAIWGNCKTIKHCVFETMTPEGDYYISISNMLNKKNQTHLPVIPYIVKLPDNSENLRNELKIPMNATVFGRYGGFDEFNIGIVHEAIREYVNINEDAYFLFMNTRRFYEHPRILYLDANLDLNYKVKFINTCDVMIHARVIGETFGLSIAEFSSKNKPIITCCSGDLEHIDILGDKAVLYSNSKDSVIQVFTNIKTILSSRKDWNAYEAYSPANVMGLFQKYIFDK